MIENDVRYKVFTGSESLQIPFMGRILRKPAPGGDDHCARQTVCVLHSRRPFWQTILDMELVEVARMCDKFLSYGPRAILQCRVDGIVACIPKKERKRALDLGCQKWECGVKKYKCEEIGPDHPTLIPRHYAFSPVCDATARPTLCPDFHDGLRKVDAVT